MIKGIWGRSWLYYASTYIVCALRCVLWLHRVPGNLFRFFWRFLTDCGGFWPTLSACPDRLGKFLKSVRPSGQIWVNLGPLCPDGFGGIWWFARSGFLTYNPGSCWEVSQHGPTKRWWWNRKKSQVTEVRPLKVSAKLGTAPLLNSAATSNGPGDRLRNLFSTCSPPPPCLFVVVVVVTTTDELSPSRSALPNHAPSFCCFECI